MGTSEKRKNLRRHLVYYLVIVDESTGHTVGRVGDISHEGLLLLTVKPPELWKNYRLRVIPPETHEEVAAFSIDAQCVWLRQDANPDIGLAGFKFVDASDDVQRVITTLMREFGFADGHNLDDDSDDEADEEADEE
jgi:hypothetical protein